MSSTYLCTFLALVTLVISPFSFAEQEQTAPPDVLLLNPEKPERGLELTAGSQHLTGGFSAWRDMTLRGIYQINAHVLQGELSFKREYDTNGTFIGVDDTYTINPDWFTHFSGGFGDGAFYLPRYRIDASLYRKFLDKKNLVGSVALGYYNAPDGHIDRSVGLAAAYYFNIPLILEAGIRLNNSSPGSVNTHQQFIAATYGQYKHDSVSARFAWGSEGYLAIASNTSLVNFDSKEVHLTWRHWLNHRSGFIASTNYYHNPTYDRSGIDIGIFHQFE